VFTAEDAVRMLRETCVDIIWIARGAIGNPWIFGHAAKLLQLARSTASPLEGAGGGEGESCGAGQRNAQRDSTCLTPLPNPLPQGERGPELAPPTIHEQRDALEEHFSIAMQIHGEQLAGRRMRKMGIKYSRFHPLGPQVKADFIAVQSLRDWGNVLGKWYASDGPGVWPPAGATDEVNHATDMQTCEAGA
jgi:tRNA-dihydrouridine synthase B